MGKHNYETDDVLEEELAHEQFLRQLSVMQERVFWALRSASLTSALSHYRETRSGGDEPIFAGIIFDMIKEEENAGI